jgi:hypothetical protein
VTFLGDSASAGATSCNNVITRTYKATDSCGNFSTCTQTITVHDTTAPSITCPGPVTVQCFSLVPAPDITSVTASDNCGGGVRVTFLGDSATAGTTSCNTVITRTYKATDACGNFSTCTQTITVHDTTVPTIACPGPVTVQCFAQVPLPDITSVTASDNCGPVTVTFVGDSASAGTTSCNNVITRTYKATDSCGNFSTCTQTITVHDTTPPVITCPPDFTVPCGTPTDPGVTGTATATDNCNPSPIITHSDVTVGTCPAGQTITRTWTASDGCQSVSCVQTITLLPPPPAFPGCVADLGGGCGAPAPTLAGGIAGFQVSLSITGASANAPGLVAVQLQPFPAPAPLATPCVLFLDPSSPNTVTLANFQTSASGTWNNNFPIPLVTMLDVRAQAAILTAGGPLGFAQLSNAIEIQRPCPPCTYTLAGWVANTGPSSMNYDQHWLSVFPSGMDIGIFNPGNGNAAPNGFHWTSTVAGRGALKTFLGTGGGSPSPIVNDATNPLNSLGSGGLARMTAVLTLNVNFNAQGWLGAPSPGFAAMIYVNPGDSLNGFTVGQILTLANGLLAGTSALPPGYTFISFTDLLENLAAAYENCVPSSWASGHLQFPPS